MTPESKQLEIDIKNLRFYAEMAQAYQWQTDVIDWRVIVATLKEIAGRVSELETALQSARVENQHLNERLSEAVTSVEGAEYGEGLAMAEVDELKKELETARNELHRKNTDIIARIDAQRERIDKSWTSFYALGPDWEVRCTELVKQLRMRDVELESAQQRITALSDWLRSYGEHRSGCPNYKGGPCNCGFPVLAPTPRGQLYT